VVQTQLFAENSNRGRKVSPEKSKSRKVHIPQEISARKVEKIEKFEKFEKSKSSHSNTFQEISARKVEKIEKFEKSKSRKKFDFLIFCEKFCNFRAVRLPARGALSRGAGTMFYPLKVTGSCGDLG